MHDALVIGIIGGTGDLGSGLARRWAAVGHKVVLGSRSREKAEVIAKELGGCIRGDDNVGAASAADIIVVAVPFSNHDATLREINAAVQGKIVVDAVVPLVPPKISVVQLPSGGSAAQLAQEVLGEHVRVVSAFHNVGASKLHAGERADCDVLVFGDEKTSRELVMRLANDVAIRGVDGGCLPILPRLKL